MAVKHHPSAQIRADCVAANLPPGAALAVAVHLEFCSVCAIGVQAMNGLEDLRSKPPGPAARPCEADRLAPRLPLPLQSVEQGRPRRIGPGLRGSELKGVSGLGEAVWLVRAAPGSPLPFGRNPGLSNIVIVEGGFRDEDEEFRLGDFVSLEERQLHRPAAHRETGCVCLIVTDATWPRLGWRRFAALLRSPL